MELIITRIKTDDEGTDGLLDTSFGNFYTMELPWRNNDSGLSCVPDGSYECLWKNHPKHGLCYELQGVPDRTAILIHSGNWAGDKTKGYLCNFEGCIGLGFEYGQLSGQKAIMKSHDAVAKFENVLQGQPFTLKIVWADGAKPSATA